MAIFFFKIFSIAIKTLARPLINWVTYYNRLKIQESNNRSAMFFKNKLIKLGQKINYYNQYMNKKIFGISKDKTIKPLCEDKALERGAEFISELIVYSILLTLPVFEMIRNYKTSQQKEKAKKDYLLHMQNDSNMMIENNTLIKSNIYHLRNKLTALNSNLYSV